MKKNPENLLIRNEIEQDYKAVENLIREAFWNLYIPGCDEHYLAHIIRIHEDFIPELDLVAELDGKVIGNVMYTKAKLIDQVGEAKEILTFGPVSILPEYQRKGYSRLLLDRSFEIAINLGYDVIVIFGSPSNYVSLGFKSCKKYNVCTTDDVFPTPMMVKELKQGALDGRKWYYHQSPAYEFDEAESRKFDDSLEPKERKYQPSQEEFYINSNSVINITEDEKA